MSSKLWRRAFAPRCGMCRHPFRIITAAIIALASASCSYDTQSIGPLAASRTATFAIESIEGPPPALIGRLAANLNEMAEARQLALVSGDEQPQYRLRGYLTTRVEGGRTLVSWVWDVYGPDMKRIARFMGDEPGAESGRDVSRDPWAMVDDRVLRRIAQSGMDRILVLLNSSEPQTPILATGAVPANVIQARLAPPS